MSNSKPSSRSHQPRTFRWELTSKEVQDLLDAGPSPAQGCDWYNCGIRATASHRVPKDQENADDAV